MEDEIYPQVMNVPEAASYLRVAPTTIYRLAHTTNDISDYLIAWRGKFHVES